MTSRIPFMAMMACLGLGACAGRTPAPVAVVQPQDRYADCNAIMAEINSNTQQIGSLGKEDGGKVAQNVVAGVAGVFIPVLWLAMDFQNASGKEGTALTQRNAYLASLAENRCNGAPVVAGQSVGSGTMTSYNTQPAMVRQPAAAEMAQASYPSTPATNQVIDRGPPSTR